MTDPVEASTTAADHAESVTGFEPIAAAAALQRAGGAWPGSPEAAWRIASPIRSQILRLMHDSEQPVVAGAAGWRVDAAIVIESLTDVMVVPAGVPVRQRGRRQIFVSDGSFARARAVVPGGIDARLAWIREGLSAGESLVIHPPDALVDGGPIRLRRKPDRP